MRLLRAGAAGAIAVLLGSGASFAKDGRIATAPIDQEAIAREAAETTSFAVGTWRLRVSWPLQIAAAAGGLFGRRPSAWNCTTVCEFRGFHIQGEAGTGGGQIAAGWASLVGETDRTGRWLSRVHVGYAVRGALLRTGWLSTLDPAAQTFAGVEGTVAATRTSVSLGVYRRVLHAGPGESWIVAAGVGWGF